jgi:Glycosyl hydrolase family 63 C-terminal domain
MPINDRTKWGPFVSERSWGTIREDVETEQDPWFFLPFEKSHHFAYRFGEDAIAGVCDRYELLVLSPVFWNRKDEILKEKLFGLNSYEGNHGEDVKEIYFHLEAMPDHSYLHYLYRYPQNKFPYRELKEKNASRSTLEGEYELIDTGIFDSDAYFDIHIEYARPEEGDDLYMRITLINEGKQEANLNVLAQLVFRNRDPDDREKMAKIHRGSAGVLKASDEHLGPLPGILSTYQVGQYYLTGPETSQALICNNQTRPDENASGFKDSFHRFFLKNDPDALNKKEGSKAALHVSFDNIQPKETKVLHFVLSRNKQKLDVEFIDHMIDGAKHNCDKFYKNLLKNKKQSWEKQVQKSALSGLIWTQSIYLFDVDFWLKKRKDIPNKPIKNLHWQHLNSKRIMIMPDKWEYPWFASWDMAFHALAVKELDVKIAEEQLALLLHDQFQHSNGQIPAYEWEYSDINPPVQAYALYQIYEKGKNRDFLEKCFHKLLINFAWWVNRIDPDGKNIFEGGFLGLDNIALWDRSEAIIHESVLKQPDSTGWMALFCLNMMKIALELAVDNKVYAGLAIKFFEHFVYIAQALSVQKSPLWDTQDGFFYDHLDSASHGSIHLKIRSIVGIIPLFAVEWLDFDLIDKVEDFKKDFFWFLENRKELVDGIIKKHKDGYLLTALSDVQINSIINYLADPHEFLAPFGMRSLSFFHKDHPYTYIGRSLKYEPRESIEKIKGGNSNWRGPIWMPMNYLIVKSLDKFKHEDHDRSINLRGNDTTISQLKKEICTRVTRLFEPVNNTPVYYGEDYRYRNKKNWIEHSLFYEYFDPDTGKGLGACHQTGWTALISELIDMKYQD